MNFNYKIPKNFQNNKNIISYHFELSNKIYCIELNSTHVINVKCRYYTPIFQTVVPNIDKL